MRAASRVVLPEPGPATISSGPSPASTASCCPGLSRERSSMQLPGAPGELEPPKVESGVAHPPECLGAKDAWQQASDQDEVACRVRVVTGKEPRRTRAVPQPGQHDVDGHLG